MSMYDYAPEEIRALPFNARRSHLYPINPPTSQQAIEDALQGEHASQYLPQRMTYSQYKNGPAAIAYGENVVGVLEAVDSGNSFVNSVVGPIEEGKGIYTPRMASRDFVRLPQARDNLRMQKDPLTRGLLDRPIVQAPGLNAYAATSRSPLSEQPDVYAQTLLSTALEGQQTPPLTSVGLGRIQRSTSGHVRRVLKQGTAGLGCMGMQDSGTVTYAVLGLAGLSAGLYHGWKRTHSTAWTIIWGLAGAWFPVITIPVAVIQGFGKKASAR